MITFKQYITEARMAPLYHGTGYTEAMHILKSNKIRVGFGEEIESISLTRSFKYARKWAIESEKSGPYDAVVFELNQQKLSYNYKILPYNYFAKQFEGLPNAKARYLKDDPVYGTNEYEERVLKDIKPLERYLVTVHVFDQRIAHDVLKKFDWVPNVRVHNR